MWDLLIRAGIGVAIALGASWVFSAHRPDPGPPEWGAAERGVAHPAGPATAAPPGAANRTPPRVLALGMATHANLFLAAFSAGITVATFG